MFELIATCPEETKDVLIKELEILGVKKITPKYKAVFFEVSEPLFYQVHLKLRTASRLLRIVKNVPAASKEMLYDQSRRIHWPEFFSSDVSFVVEGVVADRGTDGMKSNDVSKKVKEGIYKAFERENRALPRIDLKDPQVVVVAFLQGGSCVISLETSGKSMHKRGYRLDGHPAPLKETLAASILLMAGYDGSECLWDPMCGSGTIAIEGAMIALQKASQIHRKKGDFGFEWLLGFNRALWREIQDEAREERKETLIAPIVASDINPTYVELARKNALRARVEKYMHFDVRSFLVITRAEVEDVMNRSKTAAANTSGGFKGILIANLPYGERLNKNKEQELKDLYREVGNTLKRSFFGWRAALLISEDAPYKFIGLRPEKKISLLNGSIRVKLLLFSLYEGSKKGSS